MAPSTNKRTSVLRRLRCASAVGAARINEPSILDLSDRWGERLLPRHVSSPNFLKPSWEESHDCCRDSSYQLISNRWLFWGSWQRENVEVVNTPLIRQRETVGPKNFFCFLGQNSPPVSDKDFLLGLLQRIGHVLHVGLPVYIPATQ